MRLHRQRVVLELLRLAGRPVSRVELVKWCFLLKREGAAAGGSAFYEFLPHHYGPYSFVLEREVAAMAALGTVTSEARSWQGMNEAFRPASGPASADAERIITTYGHLPEDDLLDSVYARYPEFTVNSRRRRHAERAQASPAIYTVGYQHLSVDGLLNRLGPV